MFVGSYVLFFFAFVDLKLYMVIDQIRLDEFDSSMIGWPSQKVNAPLPITNIHRADKNTFILKRMWETRLS